MKTPEITEEWLLDYVKSNTGISEFSVNKKKILQCLIPLVIPEHYKVITAELDKYKADLNESLNNEQLLRTEYASLKESFKAQSTDNYSEREKLEDLKQEVKLLTELNKKLQSELEDSLNEKNILRKRGINDIKDLKSELAKEKSAHSLCKIEKEQAVQELRQNKTQKKPPTRKEKSTIELLSKQVTQFQREINAYRDKDTILKEELVYMCKENETLKSEINRLQMDIATLGAQFNEYIRNDHKKIS